MDPAQDKDDQNKTTGVSPDPPVSAPNDPVTPPSDPPTPPLPASIPDLPDMPASPDASQGGPPMPSGDTPVVPEEIPDPTSPPPEPPSMPASLDASQGGPPIITPPTPSRSKAKIVGAILAILILVVSIPAGVFLVQRTQEIREKAASIDLPPETTNYLCGIWKADGDLRNANSNEFSRFISDGLLAFARNYGPDNGYTSEDIFDHRVDQDPNILRNAVVTIAPNRAQRLNVSPSGDCGPPSQPTTPQTPSSSYPGANPTGISQETLEYMCGIWEKDGDLRRENNEEFTRFISDGLLAWARNYGPDNGYPDDGPIFDHRVDGHPEILRSAVETIAPNRAQKIGASRSSACWQSPSQPSQPAPPAPETPITAQCANVKAYDASGNQLSTAQLAQLKAGDQIRLAVGSSTSSGTIDKARFTVNGVLQPETTTKNSSGEFYITYTIPANTTSFTIRGQVHHTDSSVDWF